MAETNSGDSNVVKAVAAALTGYLFMATLSMLVKLQTSSGVSIQWIVFIQYSTCLVIITIVASKNKFRDLKTKKFPVHLIRAVSGILAFSFFVISVSYIPLVNATLLYNTAPLFIPIITFLWLRTRIDKKIWWGILIGFIGIIFILDPVTGDFFEKGDLIGICAGIFLAVAYVGLGILTKTESFTTILFYYSLLATIMVLPFAITNWSNPPLLIWIYGILTGTFFISFIFSLQYAFRFMSAVKLSPLNFSVVVFAGILDWLIFNHIPGIMSLIGIVLVSVGGILAIKHHEKNNPNLKHHWH